MTEALNSVDLEDVKIKLYNKLKPSGWADKLKTFIMSSDMDKILSALLSDSQAGKRFTPPLKQVFRAFEECPYDKTKVVMMLQDPYPYAGVASGIAMSCENQGKVMPSLRYVFLELEDTVYKDGYTWDPDLKRWSNQGVLMLNSALTTTIGKIGTHYNIWQPFIAFLLDTLTFQNPGLVYVFMGKKAQEWATSVPDNNFKLFTTHPAFAAHTKSERWDSGDVFNKVNHILKGQTGETITW